jgi:hypothetical protein
VNRKGDNLPCQLCSEAEASFAIDGTDYSKKSWTENNVMYCCGISICQQVQDQFKETWLSTTRTLVRRRHPGEDLLYHVQCAASLAMTLIIPGYFWELCLAVRRSQRAHKNRQPQVAGVLEDFWELCLAVRTSQRNR